MLSRKALGVLAVLAGRDRPAFKRVMKTKAQAWVRDGGKTIVATDGLMKLLTDEHELAFILGHELGHIALGHVGTWAYRLGLRIPRLELAADAHAIRLMRAKGYDASRVPGLFDRLMASKTGKGLREMAKRREAIEQLIEGD